MNIQEWPVSLRKSCIGEITEQFPMSVKKVPEPGPVSVKWSRLDPVFRPFSGSSDK